MQPKKCSGRDAITGQPVTVTFDRTILSVEPGGDADGLWLAPGFIDLQVNGFAGVDYNHPDTPHDEIARSVRVQIATGVTRLYPTVITGPPDAMAGCLRNLEAARKSFVRENQAEGEAIEGFHVEGPHISAEHGPRGAHPLQWVRPPDIDEYRRWQEAAEGRIRLITLAPEWPEAPRYIEHITSEGVVASIGHTGANSQQIADAVSAGATLSTHFGNAVHELVPRHPNYMWDQLAEDRLMADFIVDGIHLGAAFLKASIRAKGIERSVLVTDASTPAGATPGRYHLGEQPVDLTTDGRVVLADTDRLAGSALNMATGVANLMRLAGLSLGDAVRMASINPGIAGQIAGRMRGIVPGDRADFVQFRLTPPHAVEVAATWISGSTAPL